VPREIHRKSIPDIHHGLPARYGAFGVLEVFRLRVTTLSFRWRSTPCS